MTKEIFTPSRNQCIEDEEGGWWAADLEVGKEKLAVKYGVTGTAWPLGTATITKEESEGVKLPAAESQKVDDVVRERQPSSTGAEGGLLMCEVEEQQAVRVEVQLPEERLRPRTA